MTEPSTLFDVSHCRISRIESVEGQDALSVYAHKTGFFTMRDRFGFLNQFSPFNLYEPCISMYATDSSLKMSELMDARGSGLLKKARSEGKELYIFFSGGVDSTAMTVSLLKAAGKDLSGLHVIYTPHSVREYPEFVAHLRAVGIHMIEVEPGRGLDEIQEEVVQHDYAIAGWCADQLFGSIIHQLYPGIYHDDWRTWVGVDTAIQQFEAAFQHYGFPIRTFGEFAWFINFSCKYDHVKYTDVLFSGKITNRMIPFFDTPEFNSWSVSNFDILHKQPPNLTLYYKVQLKEYIHDYNGDDQYLWGKGKTGSWGYVSEGDSRYSRMIIDRVSVMEAPDKVVSVGSGDYLERSPMIEARMRRKTLALLHMYKKSFWGI